MSKFKLIRDKRIPSLDYLTAGILWYFSFVFHGNKRIFYFLYLFFFFLFRMGGSIEILLFQLLHFIYEEPGNPDTEINWCAQSPTGNLCSACYGPPGPGWVTGTSLRSSALGLLCSTSRNYPWQKPGNHFQLSSHQPQPGQLNFLNINELKPLLYLTSTTLNLSFDAWITIGVFSLVSLFYVWVSFGESHSQLPKSCFKNTVSPQACYSLRTTCELLCMPYKGYFFFSPFPGSATPTCSSRLGSWVHCFCGRFCWSWV